MNKVLLSLMTLTLLNPSAKMSKYDAWVVIKKSEVVRRFLCIFLRNGIKLIF